MWGTMIEGFISIGAGLVACYYGFCISVVIRGDPGMTAKWQQWHRSWGNWVKIGGVCLVLFGVFTIVTALQ